jgi:PAS domain S-box-containing protein
LAYFQVVATIGELGELGMNTTKAPVVASLAPPPNWFEREQRSHVVQFYAEDAPLLDALGRFIGTALWAGDAAIVIATKTHRDGLLQRLKARDLDVESAVEDGRFVSLDAAKTLSKTLVAGFPDAERFEEIIGDFVRQARASVPGDQRRVVAFGEMVALLWAEGKAEAAIEMEKLWNQLAQKHAFSLRCAYPMKEFAKGSQRDLFVKVCAEHSGVIPSEGYTSLPSEDDRLRSIARLQQKAEAHDADLALRQSEERFRHLVESVQDYAIFMLDTEGRVSSWNSGAERMKGYKPSEIIGKHFSCFYPDEDAQAGKPQRGLGIAARDGRFEDEGWRLRQDGSRFWANVVITPLREKNGDLSGFTKVTRDITERMRAHEALKSSNEDLRREIADRISAQQRLHDSEQSLRRLSGHLLRMQDEERRRLGRELHDSVGQYLAALKMGLDSMHPEQNDQLAECVRLAEESMKEVRTISYLLYPPMLEEMGLRSAIPWYVDGFAKRSGIQVTFEIDPEMDRLSRDAELAFFRVLQESLTNVLRHADSPTAEIRLTARDRVVCLEVCDQGKGLPAGGGEEQASPGVGLRGMAERMRQLGGDLEIRSSRAGTTVRATMPGEG